MHCVWRTAWHCCAACCSAGWAQQQRRLGTSVRCTLRQSSRQRHQQRSRQCQQLQQQRRVRCCRQGGHGCTWGSLSGSTGVWAGEMREKGGVL
eukprot:scaffold168437_cov21-Tisochrysis_lutea.AAC.1